MALVFLRSQNRYSNFIYSKVKAKLKNGSIVTGRLAEIFVGLKVANWIPEEQPTETNEEDSISESDLDTETEETLDEITQDEQVVEEAEAKEEPVISEVKPIKAKVSVPKKAKVSVKKAGRPKVKK